MHLRVSYLYRDVKRSPRDQISHGMARFGYSATHVPVTYRDSHVSCHDHSSDITIIQKVDMARLVVTRVMCDQDH